MAGSTTFEPERFGKYLLVDRVGEGGMAEVFRAEAAWVEGVKKEVCIKRILPPLSTNEKLRKMFVQEARIAASLTHANIVPVFDFGVVDDYYFLSMEFVEGYTLREVMMQSARKKRWLELPIVLHLISEALEGLDYAHRKRDEEGRPLKIVHRDVTPGNVMVSVEGEVKILDFGIAMIGDVEVAEAAGAGGRIAGRGKPGYMSPEQAVGMAVDARSDIYSLAVMLYELLVHRRLFRDRKVADPARPVTVAPPSSLNSELGQALDPIVLDALGPAPSDRYRSAAAFRDALLDYMHDNGLRAGRSQLAAALATLFDRDVGVSARAWDFDISRPGAAEGLPRPPRDRTVSRSNRAVSVGDGRVLGEGGSGPFRPLLVLVSLLVCALVAIVVLLLLR